MMMARHSEVQVVDENLGIQPLQQSKGDLVKVNSNSNSTKGQRQGLKRAFGVDLTNVNGQSQSKGSCPILSKSEKQCAEDMDLKVVVGVEGDGDSVMMDSLTSSPLVAAWDRQSISDDLSGGEYAVSIMQSLREQEESLGDFMSTQKDINSRMRVVLVDWLIDVHRKFKLSRATYFLAINMVDRYLAATAVGRSKLQLLGCTCLWTASKYHEIYAPEMDDFVYISDSAFSTTMLTEMEVEVLKTLQFELTVPTPLNYAERYSKISAYYLKAKRERKIIADLIMYCSEHCVVDYGLCQKTPSLLGAACFVYSCLSTKVFSKKQMAADGLEHAIGYTLQQLLEPMKELDAVLKNAKRTKQRALFKKYQGANHSNIAKLNFDRLHRAFLE